MIAWSSSVNSNFYGYNSRPKSNSVLSEKLSGRVVGYQANTKNLMSITCSLRLKVGSELDEFWRWFNDELGQCSGVFTCSALGSGSFRFTEVPEPQDTDLQYRELSLTIEEA